jgi:uncharacterized phage protein (TIGR02218 family)
MSFDIFEISNRAGKPVFLFKFTAGIQSYTYTTDNKPADYLGETYSPLENLEPSGTSQSQEIQAQKITVSAFREWILPRQFVSFVPSNLMFLVVFKYHRAAPDDKYVYWQGFVQSAKFDDKKSYLNCAPVSVLFNRLGLRRSFSTLCGHILYDGFCPVPASAYRVDGVITDIGSFTITAAEWTSYDSTWFVAGFVERTLPSGVTDMRLITGNDTGVLTLLSPFPSDLQTGETLHAYAGCDHKFSTCAGAKFGAYTDEGGACGCYDRIPVKNPFQTGINNVS